MKPFLTVVVLLHLLVGWERLRASESTSIDLEWRAAQKCGPNCLYVLLFMYGRSPNYDAIVSEMDLTRRGVTVADITRVAGRFGIDLQPLRADAESLSNLPLPAIVHFRNPSDSGGHYVILLSTNNDSTFTIMDCTRGQMDRISKGNFLDLWSGIILVRSRFLDNTTSNMAVLVSSGSLLVLLSSLCFLVRRKQAKAFGSTA